ncbi:MAG: hypothetical protein NZ480_01955 [Bdellovibrionaceae bacterium]|nr:hypothetical protein [Pseudobdellovibrionaceae bacterium]MDW8191147.1 hypothetical protein [Pseudobdellovibrionaceae bacterium]
MVNHKKIKPNFTKNDLKIDRTLEGRRFICKGVKESAGPALEQRLKGLGVIGDNPLLIWAVNPWLRIVVIQLETQLIGLRYQEFDQLILENWDVSHEESRSSWNAQ